jgi:hypothetical protein
MAANQTRKQGKSERVKLREFGLTVGIAFGVIAGLLYWRQKPHYIYLAVISAAFILSGLAIPVILRPVNKVWMTFSMALGWVMTRVILTILFFAVFTPIGLIARYLARERFLDLEWDADKDSYWNYREQAEPVKSDYERQF